MSSTPTTTPEPVDLDAVDARIPDGYTAPWDIDHDYESDGGWRVCYDTDAEGAGLVAVLPDYGYELALFIAHARTDVPALVAEVRQLRAERARLVHDLRNAREGVQWIPCECRCHADEHTAAPATWTPCEADLDTVAAAGKAGHLVQRRPSGALACSCGCVAGGWPGMLGHLEDDVVGPLSATPPTGTETDDDR